MKKCPTCDAELKIKVIGDVDIDECEKCGGIWFDRGELEQAEKAADSNLGWIDFEIWKHPENFKAQDTELKCPVDGTNMISIDYGHTGVRIHYSPSSGGVWLDKGEFPKIIESLENELSSKTFSEYFHDSVEEAKELVTGDKPFSSEWKDFTSVLKLMQYRLFVEKPKFVETLRELYGLNPFK